LSIMKYHTPLLISPLSTIRNWILSY